MTLDEAVHHWEARCSGPVGSFDHDAILAIARAVKALQHSHIHRTCPVCSARIEVDSDGRGICFHDGDK